MSLIVWNPSLQLGWPPIDAQHEQLVRLLNQLALAVRANREPGPLSYLLGEFTAAADAHFQTEEQLMAQARYRDLSSHVAEHRQFLQQLQDMLRRLAAGELRLSLGALTILQNGLKGHIVAADKRLAAVLAPHPATQAQHGAPRR